MNIPSIRDSVPWSTIKGSVFATLLMLALTPCSAGDEVERQSLAGLKEMAVVVEQLTPEAVRDGLSQETIKLDVELRLRQAGIVVRDKPTSPGWAYVYVNVNAMFNERLRVYAVSVRLSLNQLVVLSRNPEVEIPAITWSSGHIVLVGSANLRDVRSPIRDLVDAFINDLLAANPK
jgi:hypothetical protein